MHFNKKVDWLFSPVSSGKLCYSNKNSVNRNCSEKKNYYQNMYKSNPQSPEYGGYVSLDLKPKVFMYHAFSHIQRKQEQLQDLKKKQVKKHSLHVFIYS